MPRPPKMRSVRHDPSVVYFKPAGIPMRDLEEVALGLDELEALHLADLEGLSQEQVGEMMNVSRATAGRIIAEARRKAAAALVHGWAIRVEGGHVETVAPDDREGPGCESGNGPGSEPGRKGRWGCRRGGRV